MCRYPLVGPDCDRTIAQVVYNIYLPTQISLLVVGVLTSLYCWYRTYRFGNATGWNWKTFQLRLLCYGSLMSTAGIIRCFDPLGWNGIVPGQFDFGFSTIMCSLCFILLCHICTALAKVTATFSSTFGDTRLEKIAKIGEKAIIACCWFKICSDVILAIVIWVDLQNTWIYYTIYASVTQVALLISLYHVSYFGGHVLGTHRQTSQATVGATQSRSDEYNRFWWMLRRVQTGLVGSMVMVWTPTIWWISHRCNFADNPPGVPGSAWDYLARTFHIWMIYGSGVNQVVFQNVRFVEKYKNAVDPITIFPSCLKLNGYWDDKQQLDSVGGDTIRSTDKKDTFPSMLHIRCWRSGLSRRLSSSSVTVLLNYQETASLKNVEFATSNLPPLIILHGLLGSLNNFRRIANNQQLSKNRRVICVDLRNHGASPHSEDMTFDALSSDVLHLMDHLSIERAVLLGHSLGGKVAMATALNHSQRISGVIVADMAPVDYTKAQQQRDWNSVKHIVTTVSQTNPNDYKGRKELEEALADKIRDLGMRQFVVANAAYEDSPSGDKVWRWRINVPVLLSNLDYMASWPYENNSSLQYPGKALFISGRKSSYVLPEYHENIRQLFPQAQFEALEGAGHWVHADKPKEFIDSVGSFLRSM